MLAFVKGMQSVLVKEAAVPVTHLARGLSRGGGGRIANFFRRQLAGFGLGYKNTLHPGEMSLPQAAGAYLKNPKKTFLDAKKNMTPGQYGMMGLFGAMNYPDLRDKPEERGKTIGRIAGDTLGWMALPRMPFIPALVGWGLASSAGSKIGEQVDKLRR